MPRPAFPTLFCLIALPVSLHAADPANPLPGDTKRVTVSVNADGSRTVYEIDGAQGRGTATTTSAAGRTIGRIVYKLDDTGRFESGEVFGADGKFQFNTEYQYDAAGRLVQESRLDRAGVLGMRLVYAYDGDGRQAGYAVYDGAGKLLGRTRTAAQSAPAAGASRASNTQRQRKKR